MTADVEFHPTRTIGLSGVLPGPSKPDAASSVNLIGPDHAPQNCNDP